MIWAIRCLLRLLGSHTCALRQTHIMPREVDCHDHALRVQYVCIGIYWAEVNAAMEYFGAEATHFAFPRTVSSPEVDTRVP